jgi:chromosome segregation protein
VRFTRLKLLGFKTFVDSTEFMIEPGLTGVVGPNGCGKSNLVEALRWVMGENSYKSMRASGMDDVIFAGSTRRAARNSAEVTLFLDNRERRVAAPHADADILEVTRRIEREAGSIYRINGRDVRARDVQLLFADASTGSRSPAMVRQGQIGELISAKPTARRAILEEAAGISGLHSRRNEAEIRLKAASQNLERVEDVLTEFETRLESLKRQARQAARYRNLSAEIRQAEATIALLRLLEARERVSEAERDLLRADKAVGETAEVQARAARDQAVAAHDLPRLRDAEAAASAALQRLRLAAAELDAEERRVRDRLGELERRIRQIDEDRAREDRLGADMAAALDRLAEEEDALSAENEDVAASVAEAEDRLAEAEAKASEAEAVLAEIQARAADAQARRRAFERAKAEAAERLGRLVRERETAQAERDRFAESLGDGEALEAARFAVEDAAAAAVEADAAVAEAEERVQAARDAFEGGRGATAEREREVSRLEAEAKTLAKILDVAAGTLWPPIIDRLRVDAGYETALGAALGDDLEVSTDEAAPVHWSEPGHAAGDPPLPGGATPMWRYVEGPAVIARRLAQIGLVDRADGPRLQKQLAPGQRLVSREGDLWRWDGLSAAADAPTAAARRLSSRNRLFEVEAQIVEARRDLASRRAALEQAQRQLREAEEAERATRETARRAQRAEAEARDRAARLEREAELAATRLAALDATLARLAGEMEEAEARGREAVDAEAELPDTSRLDHEILTAQGAVARDRAVAAELRAARQGLAREVEMRVRRLEAIGRERAGWTARAAAATSQLAVLAERRAEAEAEREALTERPADIEDARRRLLDEIGTAEATRSAAAEALAAGERSQGEADRVARTALEALSAAREAKGRAEERHAAARARRMEIESGIAETFEVQPIGLATLAGIDMEAPLPEEIAVERRLERLKLERERLGAVNLRADDEAQEVEERRDVLAGERDELVEAIRRLRTGISNLNREARERLMAAFETVDGHFRSLFTHLFGGGEAELQLIESEDPLEAGLEIVAKPPGKKPTTMTLLSGGEQALTALALIFAVFLTNPAPICVLDEVDAPLDDANVERYCDLLDRMASVTDTRFVVITHNPITMARMNRLFGVTMSERGISQLVSVDLERAERILETA